MVPLASRDNKAGARLLRISQADLELPEISAPHGAICDGVAWRICVLVGDIAARACSCSRAFGFFAHFYWRILGNKYNYSAQCLGTNRLFHLNLDPASPPVKLTDKTQSLDDRVRSLAAKAGRSTWLRSLFQRRGLFGEEGKHFFFVLFCREMLETSLQTNQAYRMTFYLPRVALNRFYVSLIVLNCWSTPLILHVYNRDEAKKRFICLVCDCVQDLVAAVVVPCTITVAYVSDFDMTLCGLP
ncbi:hypothetical protein FI667_g3115, partial [Globisporangium splendens]